jgi:hypothetical protein
VQGYSYGTDGVGLSRLTAGPTSFNFFEEGEMEKQQIEYRPLWEVISLTGLLYDYTYRWQESDLLEPQLLALGYTNIQWQDGERDSFGPLTRVCSANDKHGTRVYFVYG